MKSKFFIYLCLFCFFTPEAIRFNQYLPNALDYINALKAVLYIVLLIRTFVKKNQIVKPLFLIICIEGLILISTIINGNKASEYFTWLNTTINITGIFILFSIAISEKFFSAFFEYLYKYIKTVVILNLIIALILPNGIGISSMDNMWGSTTDHIIHLMGFKNNWFLWLLPYSVLSELRVEIFKRKRGLSPLISLSSAFYCESSTCILSLSLFYLVIYFKNFPIITSIEKSLGFGKIFLMVIVINIAIVILRIQDIFSFIIKDILHKELDFTQRTSIWDQALVYIIKSPFLGYGNGTNGKFLNIAGYEIPAHNLFLDIILQGGFITFVLFLALTVCACKYIKYLHSKNTRIILNMSILFLFIASLMETYFSKPLFYIPFLLSYFLYFYSSGQSLKSIYERS